MSEVYSCKEVRAKAAALTCNIHVPALDGVRGLAILGVLMLHFYQRPINHIYPAVGKVLSRIVEPGRYGVELFFVLSGLLITGILLDTKDHPGFFRKFYIRRLLRIFPLYYGSLAVVLLLLPRLVRFDEGARAIAAHQIWLWTYLANWPTAYIWNNSHQFLLGHFWSLSVEEHFYILWPSLVFLLSRSGLFRACVLVIAIGIVSRTAGALLGEGAPAFLRWSTLTRIDGLGVGAILAILLRGPEAHYNINRARLFYRFLFIFFALFLALMLVPRNFHFALIDVLGESIIVTFFGLAIWWALKSQPKGPLNYILSSSFLVAFGKYSYGIYVIHAILMPTFDKVFDLDQVPKIFGLPVLCLLLHYIVAIAGSFLLAYLSYHLFEKHFLSLKRYFAYS